MTTCVIVISFIYFYNFIPLFFSLLYLRALHFESSIMLQKLFNSSDQSLCMLVDNVSTN